MHTPNMKRFWQWALYKRLGWTKNVSERHPDKYILCVAPHTSNWDFAVGMAYRWAEGFRTNFLMKKEWFFWPLGPLFRHLGGIPVYRAKNCHLTQQLAEAAKAADTFALTITPEGTRSLNSEWKRGFYYIALEAGIPILLYAIDFGSRTIHCTKTFTPTGDVDADMTAIKQYYHGFKGKHPERFTTGDEQ